MKNKIISFTLVIIGFTLGASALSTLAVWTAPGTNCTPPNCNVPAPLNVGSVLQEKLGALWLKSGLAVDGNLLISTSSPSAGDVLTAVDENGTVSWAPAGGAGDSSAFCNTATAAGSGYAILSLLKNGVNMCTDVGGCTIKLTEINPSVGIRTSIVSYHQLASQIIAGSLTIPSNSWGAVNNTGTNGDSSSNAILGILNGGLSDDKPGIEQTADQIVLGEGTVASVYRAEVCDF